MRAACLCYFEFTAADEQHAQRNEHGMLYLGFVAFCANHKMRNLVEVICVKENVETYVQTILDMKDMEPALDVSGMKIMFRDEVVRKKIAVTLDIEDTCLNGGS